MLKLRMVDRNILDHYTDLPVGEVLRRARIQFGLELPYVAAHLNLRPEHIAAIEAGDIARLPGRVYAIGFVRAYADYLKRDSDKVVYLFKSQCVGHTTQRDLNFPIPVTESRSPAWWMVAASIGTLVIIGRLFVLLGDVGSDDEAQPDMPAAISQTKPAQESDQAIAQGDGKLKVTAIEASWVEIRDGNDTDKILFSRVLKKDESYTAPAMDNLVLSTGNAEGVKVFWDNKTVDVFEGRKGIVRDLPVSALTSYKIRASEAPKASETAIEPASGQQSTPVEPSKLSTEPAATPATLSE